MHPEAERAARAALVLAGVDAAMQRQVLAELPKRLDRTEASIRRNAAIREAHRLIGSVCKLTKQLHDFYERAWPQLRHMIKPPDDATPLRRAFFLACQGAEDSGKSMPDERQIRRVIS